MFISCVSFCGLQAVGQHNSHETDHLCADSNLIIVFNVKMATVCQYGRNQPQHYVESMIIIYQTDKYTVSS